MKIKNYISLSINIFEEDFEIAYSILTDFPFIGMEEKLDELVLYFEEKDWSAHILNLLTSQISQSIPNAKISNLKILSEKNGNEEGEKNVEPVHISDNIVITPEGKITEFNCKHKIIINPKMSFGTGSHSTTKLMAIMIENFILNEKNEASIKNSVGIDAGTGTGVLAIIAAKLGAKKVYAFDNDEGAYENSQENIVLNDVQDIIEVECCSIENYAFPNVNCICANMFLDLLKKAFSKFRDALTLHNGILFASGILLFDRDELLTSATDNGFIVLDEMQELEGCCFKFGLK